MMLIYLLSRKINRLPISRNTVFLTVCRVHVRSALPPLLNGHQSSEPTILFNRLLRIFSTLLTFVILQMQNLTQKSTLRGNVQKKE